MTQNLTWCWIVVKHDCRIYIAMLSSSQHSPKKGWKSEYVDHRGNNSNKNSLVTRKMQTKPIMKCHLYWSDLQNYQVLYYCGLVWTWSIGTLLHCWWVCNFCFILEKLGEILSITAALSSSTEVNRIGQPVWT